MDRPPHLHLAPAAPDPALPAEESEPELPALAEIGMSPHLVPVSTQVDAVDAEPRVPSVGVTMLPLPCPDWCDRHREVSEGYVVHEGAEETVDGGHGRPLVRLRSVMGMVSGEDTPPSVAITWVAAGRRAEFSVDEVLRLSDALRASAEALDGYPRP